MKQPIIETAKFVARMVLFIAVPIIVSQAAELTGTWQTLVGVALPVLLPIIDKWIYLDERIPARGIVPF